MLGDGVREGRSKEDCGAKKEKKEEQSKMREREREKERERVSTVLKILT